MITVVKTADGEFYMFDTFEKTCETDNVCFDYLAAVPLKIGMPIEIFCPTHHGSCEVGKIIVTKEVVSIRSGEELDAASVS